MKWSGITIESSDDQIIVELMDATDITFYAPNTMSIDSITNILNTPSILIEVGSNAYTLGNSISTGSQITINASTESVIKLNITNY